MAFSPRHLVWVNLVLLALVAYLSAATVSSAIAARLNPPLTVALAPPPDPIRKGPKRPPSYYTSIHTRDFFNDEKPKPPPPPEKVDTGPAKATELRLKLWGVVIDPGLSASRAVIEDLTVRKQELYKIGDTVGGQAEVKEVQWDKVVLLHNGREEVLEMEAPSSAPAPKAAAPNRGRRRNSNRVNRGRDANRNDRAEDRQPRSADRQFAGIEKVSDGEYVIERGEVEAALDNMNQLFTQIRAVPHFEGGESTGFRLFAIRQNSIFDKIGLRNGDIIQNVNGNPISDPSKALGMFQDLRNANDLTVQIVRNKQDKTINYRVN